jgi:hypothetical protein
VRFALVGGGSNTHRQCGPSSSSGGASPSSPSANINVVQGLGNSDKDVISQAGVTREFNAAREEANAKLNEAKAYTDEEIAKAAIGGGGDINLSDYAKKEYVDNEVQKVKDYTGDYNNLENKPTIPSLDGYATEDYVTTQVGDVNEVLELIINGCGDANPTAKKKAVTFYDYDGTIRYSYTAAEFLALTEMPPLPTQQGLICQEWNWSYEDAIEYVAEYGVLDVGATYITDDGKTRLYIRIAAEGRMDVPLYFQQAVANGVTIDWGDGSATETLNGTGKVNTTHHYNSIGDYMISLDVAEGCTLTLGHGTDSTPLTGGNLSVYRNMLYKAEIGKNVQVTASFAFDYNSSLEAITMPNSITSILNQSFRGCYSLPFLIVPNSVGKLSTQFVTTCYSMKAIILPNSITTIDGQSLRSMKFKTIVLPTKIQTLPAYFLESTNTLANIIIPKNITSIAASAFSYCTGMAFYDFSHHTAVPTLANTNAFTGIPSDCKIIVPDALYDEWIAATNWSAYATYTIKKSEWDDLKQGGSL